MDKFINDAIVGNQTVTASFSKKGELLRLFYPQIDYKQFVEQMHVGVKVNDSGLVYLHADVNNIYMQSYIENTNILQTEILNTYFDLRVLQTDYVPIKENILVRKFLFKNESDKPLNIDLLVYSKILTNINNDTCGYIKNDTLIQYNHDYSVCLFSKEKFSTYQINGSSNNFMSGVIGGKDYIGLSSDSSVSYNLGEIKPGETVSKCLYISKYLKCWLLSLCFNFFNASCSTTTSSLFTYLINGPSSLILRDTGVWSQFYLFFGKRSDDYILPIVKRKFKAFCENNRRIIRQSCPGNVRPWMYLP